MLFLVLGVVLRRWDRVKEASPVFLALGAILTPLNFLLLYSGVLRDGDTPQEWVWLIGSTTTAALYYLLAARGFGRLYVIPAGLATLLAWGSLGATLGLPARWFGAWFMTAAVGINAIQRTGYLSRRYCEVFAAAMAVPALTYALFWLAFDDSRSWQTPVTSLLAAATIAISALPSRRAVPLALLPPAAGLFVGSLVAAVPLMNDAGRWLSLWLLVTAAAFAGLAEVRRDLRDRWLLGALACGVVALAYSHLDVLAGGGIAARLPVTYLVALSLSGFVAWRHRHRYAFALLPPLAAGSGASMWWIVASFKPEWLGLVFVSAGAVYLVFAWLRASEAPLLRGLALAFGAGGLALSISAASAIETEPYQLPVTFALFALASIIDGFRYRPSWLASPIALAFAGSSLLWATGVDPEWWSFPALAAGLGIAFGVRYWRRDIVLELAGWPYALLLALAPVFFVADFQDSEPIGAAAFACSAAIYLLAGALGNGAISRLLRISHPRAATFEQQMLARLGAWMLFVSVGYTNAALGLSLEEGAWTFTGVGIACWLAVPILRGRLSIDALLGPVGLTAFAIAAIAGQVQTGQVSLMLAMGVAAGVVAIGGSRPGYWRTACLVLGAVALFAALDSVNGQAREWEVPLALAILVGSALADAITRRSEPSWLFVPILGSLAVASAIWWREWPPEQSAWTPLAFAIAIGATSRWWEGRPLLARTAWPYALVLALAPILFFESYNARPIAGAAAFALAASAWGIASWRSNGNAIALLEVPLESRRKWDRRVLAWVASALLLVSAGYVNAALKFAWPESAWLFIALSTAAFALIAVPSRMQREIHWLAAPGAFLAIIPAVVSSEDHFGQLATVFAITAASAAGVLAGTRRSPYGVVSVAFGFLAVGFVWTWRDWPTWSLALAYACAAIALFLALAPHRKRGYKTTGGQVAALLSTVPIAISLFVALSALGDRAGALPDAERIAGTVEWRSLAGIVAIIGLMLAGEGWWQKLRAFLVAGSAVLLLALELGIATLDPSNVQAYTIPAAAYFIALGLLLRSNRYILRPHLTVDELCMLAGAAFLVLPPAKQSLDGEAVMGLVLIAEGLALFVAGLLISQRWLTVSGTLTLGGAAVRFFTAGEGSRLPYWLTIGIVGLTLLGLGVLLLLERDWWSRTRQRLGSWWMGDQPPPDQELPPRPAS